MLSFITLTSLAPVRYHETSLGCVLICYGYLHPTDPTCIFLLQLKNKDTEQSRLENRIWKLFFLTPWDFLCSDFGCQPESTGSQPKPSTRPTKPPPVFSRSPPASPWGLIRRESCLYITSILQDLWPLEPGNNLMNWVYSLQVLVDVTSAHLLVSGMLWQTAGYSIPGDPDNAENSTMRVLLGNILF